MRLLFVLGDGSSEEGGGGGGEGGVFRAFPHIFWTRREVEGGDLEEAVTSSPLSWWMYWEIRGFQTEWRAGPACGSASPVPMLWYITTGK